MHASGCQAIINNSKYILSVDPYIDIRYFMAMIKSVTDKTTIDIYDGTNSKHSRRLPRELHPKARRLLDQINAAPSIQFLRIPPGNRLEKLSGDMEAYWSVRINDQWRIVFRWTEGDAYDVRITDYH